MKKLVCLSFCLMAGTASAGVINNFTGYYDVSNWSKSLDGGVIDTSNAPFSILEISTNDWLGSSSTSFTIAAQNTGSISFDWFYSTEDWSPFYDPFGYLLNGDFNKLTQDRRNEQGGRVSFDVNAGDIFGFAQNSFDAAFGSGATKISEFVFRGADPVAVPEPSTLVLLGLGLAGVGFSRKMQKNATRL